MFLVYSPKVKKQLGNVEKVIDSIFFYNLNVKSQNNNVFKDQFNNFVREEIARIKKKYFQTIEFPISKVLSVQIKIFTLGWFSLLVNLKFFSTFVNPNFYNLRYPDIHFSRQDPVIHFWTHGYFEMRSPKPELIPVIKAKNLAEFYEILNRENYSEYFTNCIKVKV